jgi:hypothetical protein
VQPGWELYSEMSAFSGTAVHKNPAAVLLNDSVRNREPQPCSFACGFGGKKGIKNPSDIFFRDA